MKTISGATSRKPKTRFRFGLQRWDAEILFPDGEKITWGRTLQYPDSTGVCAREALRFLNRWVSKNSAG